MKYAGFKKHWTNAFCQTTKYSLMRVVVPSHFTTSTTNKLV